MAARAASIMTAVLIFVTASLAQTTAFTYQGRFTDSSASQPTNGSYNMAFRLFDAATGGNQVPKEGADVNALVSVINGVFTVKLDYGAAAFSTSGSRYLEIQVGATVLSPRQEITSAPFANRSRTSAAADSLSDNCVGCVTADKLAPGVMNTKNVAMLRWYETNQTNGSNSFYPVCASQATLFDGRSLWYGCTSGLYKIDPFDFELTQRASSGLTYYDMTSDGTFVWSANGGSSLSGFPLKDGFGSVSAFVSNGFFARGVLFDGANLWVSSYENPGRVAKLTYGTGSTPVATAIISVGNSPDKMAFDGTNVWVFSNQGNPNNGWITKINAANQTTTNIVLDTNVVARGLAFDGTHMWASLSSNNVIKIRASDNTIVGTYPVGSGPEDVVFDGVNIWVANTSDNTVTKLRASTGALVGTYSSGGIFPKSMSFDGANIWVANQNDGKLKKL